MRIQILVDNPNSWILPYARELHHRIEDIGHECRLIHKHKDVIKGDILCLLGCERIFRDLAKNKHNLVVHESDLPQGKGWSPMTWQILEGKNRIPVTLFEAQEGVDSGQLYLQEIIEFEGHELLGEIKHQQGVVSIKLVLHYIMNYPNIKGKDQKGTESFYEKRTPADSELDISKSIADQFNLLRVCDNERYPAYFHNRNQKYIIKIYKSDD
jgi:methionyl-tRNA formyltransferase